MTRNFIILTSEADAAQQKLITDTLKTDGGWWHWFPQSWLFVTNYEFTALTLRDKIGAAFGAAGTPLPKMLILRVGVDSSDGAHWGGYSLPQVEGMKSVDWLNEDWKNK